MSTALLSICIPSYNRPNQLGDLLASIDVRPGDIEIVIGEDCAPERTQVRDLVKEFSNHSPYSMTYYENENNLGYDGNLRKLISRARGEFVLFMGDDDLFAPGKLDLFIDFIKANRDVG